MVSATLRVNLPAQLLAQSNGNGSPLEVPVDGQVPAVRLGFAPPTALPPVNGANPAAWAPNPAATQPVTAGRVGYPQDGGHNTASALVGSTDGGGSSSGGLVLLVIVVVLMAVVVVAVLTRRRLVPALTALTASPAQKRAAGVRAFLPSPAPSGPATPVASTAVVPGAPAATGTTGAQDRRRVSSPTVPKETSTPAVPVLVPVPEGPAQLPGDLL